MTDTNDALKADVRSHWERETCGTRYAVATSRQQYFDEITLARDTLEGYIHNFAQFPLAKGKQVLEIGVGAGTDFCQWIRHGAHATGIDLTEAAIRLTRERLELAQVPATAYDVRVADAEQLPFPDAQFDWVYSWGVLHHTPNTPQAFREAWRVLKPGGVLKVMIYHIPCWTGWMLWLQHALLKGRPLQSVRAVIFQHLESPGTKAYTVPDAHAMLTQIGFTQLRIRTQLGSGDLLTIKPSAKYQHPLFKVIWKIYPRWLVSFFGDGLGVMMLIDAQKPAMY